MTPHSLSGINVTVQDPPQKFKEGDKVIVTNPEFVVRVGYPLSYAMAYEHVKETQLVNVRRFLDETMFPVQPGESIFGMCLTRAKGPNKEERMILQGLAWAYLHKEQFGGPERTIHTESRPYYHGRVLTVGEKRVCKTGTYDAPYSHQDYFGEWDCYPGGLTNCKTHVLLRIEHDAEIMPYYNEREKYSYGNWIESKNVRLYEET